MTSSLISAKDLASRENHKGTRERIENKRAFFKHIHPLASFNNMKSSAVTPVNARVDFGRWLADCECGGAEYVDPEEPVFFCNSCGNSQFEGELRPVIFPSEKTRQEIEKLLMARPVDDSRGIDPIERAMFARPIIAGLARNWSPDETIKDLKSTNRKAGVK